MLKRLARFPKHSKGILLLSLVLSAFLFGCSAEKSEPIVLNIPNVDDYTVLLVQGVDENGAASSGELINDSKKIEEFISIVNKVDVVKPSREEMVEKNKELNLPGNYIVVLSNAEEMNDKMYTMNFFKDGTIYFQHAEKNELAYSLKEKNLNFLNEIKSLLDITF